MSYELMFQKAVQLQQDGALNEAEQLYRQILETAPDNANVLNMLGLIAQSRGMHQEAVAYFYRAAEKAPQHFPIFFNLAISLGALNRHLEAIEALQKVIKLKPDLPEAHYSLGNIYWQQNRISEAKAAFQKALEINADYLSARTNLAEINDDIATLEQISADNPDALYYLGRRAWNDKDFAKAVQYLAKADKLTTSTEIKALLAEALEAEGQAETALPIFYQAYRLAPQDDVVLTHIADLEAFAHNYGEAETFYKKAIAANPQNLQAHTNFANLLCAKKRTVEALEEYRQAVLIAPQTPELSYNLALILKSLEEYEQALDLMFHAFYLAPEHCEWALNLAETLVLLEAKAPEKALKITENWYQKMPEHIVVKHLWAVINHRPSTVESEYNRLLFNTFAPTYEQTLQNINYAVVDKIGELCAPLSGKILDLGCGTGLLAQKLKTTQNSFIGVDIAEQMLNIARAKGVYDALENADISAYLQAHQTDLPPTIVAADVFCYFGDLAPIFKLCAGKRLIFSVESDASVETFKIQPNGRYQHNPQHVEDLLQQAGFTHIKKHRLTLRCENGADVEGVLFDAD